MPDDYHSANNCNAQCNNNAAEGCHNNDWTFIGVCEVEVRRICSCRHVDEGRRLTLLATGLIVAMSKVICLLETWDMEH